MSMLAEKKRKQRWSLNPRGNVWTEDSNKFGQKMLEKMGWKHGKGLGANEDGIKEHLKVSYKNDSKGMGFKEIEGWTEHEDNFSALLKNLSNMPDVTQTDLQVKSTSLEEMSQKSRVRVHYHKFTKGKDLSRYSEKDLASIFGKKSLTPHKEPATAANNDNSEKFIKKGCMVDYFKKKLPNFSLSTNGYVVGSNGVLQFESGAFEEGERGGFGYDETARSLTIENSSEDKETNSKKECKRKLEETKNDTEVKALVEEQNGCESIKKKKKNRKAKSEETENLTSTFVSYLKKVDGAENNERDSKEEGEISKLEKKRRRKSSNVDLQEEERQEAFTEEAKVSECGKDQNIKENKRNRKEKQKDTSDSEENLKEKKEKKKKSKRNNTDLQSRINQGEQTSKVLEDTKVNEGERTTFISYLNIEDNLRNDDEYIKKEPEKIKAEKRRKHKNDNQEETNNSLEEKTKFHKKKEETEKLNVKQNTELDTKELKTSKKVKASKEANEAEAENPQIKPKPLSTKKRSNKPKKNIDDTNQGISNLAFDPQFNKIVVEKHILHTIVEGEETFNDTKNETPPKKAKKKKDLDTIVEAEETFNDADNETPTNQKSKKKKVRHATTNENLERIESEGAGFDNPSFKNCSEETGPADDNQQDNPYEVKPKRKKKKRNDDDGIDNPVFCEEIQISSKKRKLNDESSEEKYEVKRKEKKLKKNKREEDDALALDNPGFQEGVESENQNGTGDGELLLNVVSLPVPISVVEKSEASQGLKYRRNVRFNEAVDQRMFYNDYHYDNNQRFIQQNYYRRNRNEVFDVNQRVMQNGIDNAGYDRQGTNMQENIAHMSRTFDRYHAEIENDINESKASRSNQQCYVGEPGHSIEKHIKVMDGTRLSFQNVSFGKLPIWMRNQRGAPGPKKSYRHLIRGDIIVKFNNTNLHEITGYATSACKSRFIQ